MPQSNGHSEALEHHDGSDADGLGDLSRGLQVS